MNAHGLVLLAASLLVAGDSPKPATPGDDNVRIVEEKVVQYTINLTVVKADPGGRDFGADGRGKLLAEPRLVTREGTSATFLAGGQLRVPGAKDGTPEFLPFGVSVHVRVTGLNDRRLRLETALEISQVERSDKESVAIVGRTIRSASTVKLGEVVKLTEKDDQGEIRHWVKIQVVEERASIQRTRAARGEADSPKPYRAEELEHEGRRPGRSVMVGQLKIVGNTTVKDDVILKHVPLMLPGQRVDEADLRETERSLERSNLFRVEPEKGIRPTITVLDPDGKSECKDILIEVEEKPGAKGKLPRR